MRRFVEEKGARRAERCLCRVAEELKCLDIRGKGWRAIGPGFRAAYSEGRSACETVLNDAAPENFHEWRKRAKDLWYQVTLLRPVWPEQMDALAQELETLGEYLGDDHDLFVLQQNLREQCTDESGELEILYSLIDERQRELRAAAVALGRRIYAEKPWQFSERLEMYWQAWRRQKRRRVCAAKR